MKTFEVILTKSYNVRIKAKNKDKAKKFSELFTGDIRDISSPMHRKIFNFRVENIGCKVNYAFEANENIMKKEKEAYVAPSENPQFVF